MKFDKRTLATLALMAVAAVAAGLKYKDYITNPWTRNGMVRANVIQVTPRISGPIVELPIVDNQSVDAGQLLFRIDPRTFKAELDEAESELERTRQDYDRALDLVKRGDISKRNFDKAESSYEIATARLEAARLNMEFTEVRASVNGLVTNLTLRIGSQAVANQPVMALIDRDSFWIHGYFRETSVGNMEPGNRALVTLMSYPGETLRGRVDSLGWGIAQTDGASGADLLPTVEPTFEWIRLAQRVPVRVHLEEVPPRVKLRVGTTASVLVKTGSTE